MKHIIPVNLEGHIYRIELDVNGIINTIEFMSDCGHRLFLTPRIVQFHPEIYSLLRDFMSIRGWSHTMDGHFRIADWELQANGNLGRNQALFAYQDAVYVLPLNYVDRTHIYNELVDIKRMYLKTYVEPKEIMEELPWIEKAPKKIFVFEEELKEI